MQFTSPIVVTLRSNPGLGEGIAMGGETYMDILKNDDGTIARNADGGPSMVKRRDVFVYWPSDPSEIFVHQLGDLVPVEVIAVRTLDEMKKEVIDEIMELLDEDEDEDEGEDPGIVA